MWDESVNMFSLIRNKLYKTSGIISKENVVGGKMLTELGQAAGREAAQELAEKTLMSTTKTLGKTLLSEGVQASSRELAQSTLKETGQSSIKKLFSSTSKKLSSSGATNLAQSSAKELAQQSTKQAAQSGATSFVKKVATVGVLGGGVFAASKIRTDTNGDGVVDDKDDTLLSQGSKTVGGVIADVVKPIAGAGLDIGGEVLNGVLGGLGIDLEGLKEKYGSYVMYAFYFILFLIAVKLLSIFYSGMKMVGIVGKTQPITIIQPARS